MGLQGPPNKGSSSPLAGKSPIFNRKYIDSFIHGGFSSLALLVIQDVIHLKNPLIKPFSLFFVGGYVRCPELGYLMV